MYSCPKSESFSNPIEMVMLKMFFSLGELHVFCLFNSHNSPFQKALGCAPKALMHCINRLSSVDVTTKCWYPTRSIFIVFGYFECLKSSSSATWVAKRSANSDAVPLWGKPHSRPRLWLPPTVVQRCSNHLSQLQWSSPCVVAGRSDPLKNRIKSREPSTTAQT